VRPFNARNPSRPMMGNISKPASGSARHHPSRAFSTNPPRVRSETSRDRPTLPGARQVECLQNFGTIANDDAASTGVCAPQPFGRTLSQMEERHFRHPLKSRWPPIPARRNSARPHANRAERRLPAPMEASPPDQ
jgi:hypothetical protein